MERDNIVDMIALLTEIRELRKRVDGIESEVDHEDGCASETKAAAKAANIAKIAFQNEMLRQDDLLREDDTFQP